MSTTDYEKEKEVIKEAIMKYYHEGHAKNDFIYYEQILHPEWRFFLFDDEGKLQIVDRDEYYSWYVPEELDQTLEWETEFYSIDITENIASVKLRIECQEAKFIDYFNMMKIDGKWWIVHKISISVDEE